MWMQREISFNNHKAKTKLPSSHLVKSRHWKIIEPVALVRFKGPSTIGMISQINKKYIRLKI